MYCHQTCCQELQACLGEFQIKQQAYTAWQHVVEKITVVERPEMLNNYIEEWVNPAKPFVLAFVNAHAMNLISTSEVFASQLLQADVLLRDGSGMAKLFRLLHSNPGDNLNGTDLIPRLIPLFNKKKIALMGTEAPFLSAARIKILSELAPECEIHVINGFCLASDYVSFCEKVAPDLVILGMGMPKQESIAMVLREKLSKPCLIVCGGAIIDFLGGKVIRAPNWVRDRGIEWVYRLLIEPRRLFKRYVIGNPLFLIRARKFANTMSEGKP